MIRVTTLATIVEKHERACAKHNWTGYTLAEMLHAEAGEQQEIEQAINRGQIHGPHGIIDEIHDKIAVLIRTAEALETSEINITAAELSCTWRQEDEDSDTYTTDCCFTFALNDGPPSENGMKYCPHCGRPIIENLYQPEDEDADN